MSIVNHVAIYLWRASACDRIDYVNRLILETFEILQNDMT
eukprot:CAMPEP_0170083124 /NCGR_PEP_ID=MMETSP0019_2-20121128/18526_1 /TAXON_ID=98059 /ORGANISM="Dinobryon sp., Strain UTEXLB2267" /LENGTH=39 /DNA_ID= /DNA_START= /DNA_END= /DNA_ORIENTATION=